MISGGVLLIIIGLIIWLNKMGIWQWSWGRDWPVILVIIGIISIIENLESKGKFVIYFKKSKKGEEQ
jgi:Na+/H+ antiporter NhaD/arsenite permease-like protein